MTPRHAFARRLCLGLLLFGALAGAALKLSWQGPTTFGLRGALDVEPIRLGQDDAGRAPLAAVWDGAGNAPTWLTRWQKRPAGVARCAEPLLLLSPRCAILPAILCPPVGGTSLVLRHVRLQI